MRSAKSPAALAIQAAARLSCRATARRLLSARCIRFPPLGTHNRRQRPRLRTSLLVSAFAFGGNSKDAGPVAQYQVAPGDTLWDIARMHGVTVAAVREANGMKPKDNTITEGEMLNMPSGDKQESVGAAKKATTKSAEDRKEAAQQHQQHNDRKEKSKGQEEGRKEKAPSSAVNGNKSCVNLPGMTPAQRQSTPDLWQNPRSMVKGITADGCEQLLHDNLNGLLEKDILLVVYAPWCPYCKEIETSVEDLARGLKKDKSVEILKLRGDSAATRLWLKAQLGIETFPSILGFPQDGGGPLRYIGARDTASLLQFMNLHCRSINVGSQQLRFEPSAGNSLLSPLLNALPTATGGALVPGPGALLKGILLVAAVAAAALFAQAQQSGGRADATERAKAVKKQPQGAEAAATVSSSDVEELDQSIRNLLKLLMELLALRIDVMRNNLAAMMRRIGRFLTGPPKPPQTRPQP